MKVPPKPYSSPGRTTDDFPPPLMRFPRSKSNRGSRSRANPMFVRKINTVIDTSQEPTSPKVTCIGQVRVKRSSKDKQTTTSGTTATGVVCRCRWIRKLKRRWFLCVYRINLSFFRCDCCRKSENVPESKRTESNERSEYLNRQIGDEIRRNNNNLSFFPCDCCLKSDNSLVPESKQIAANERSLKREIGDEIRPVNKNLSFFGGLIGKKENSVVSVSEPKRIKGNERTDEYLKHEIRDIIHPDNKIFLMESPPRNALLLTRSRSAPYRSSSLASKFLESTMENNREFDPTLKKFSGEVIIVKENGEEDEGSINGVEEFKAKPLNLSRCKSEPARIGDKLFTSFAS